MYVARFGRLTQTAQPTQKRDRFGAMVGRTRHAVDHHRKLVEDKQNGTLADRQLREKSVSGFLPVGLSLLAKRDFEIGQLDFAPGVAHAFSRRLKDVLERRPQSDPIDGKPARLREFGDEFGEQLRGFLVMFEVGVNNDKVATRRID